MKTALKIKGLFTYLLLAFSIGLSAFLRLYHIPDRPFVNDVWLWTIGFNLHKAHFFNLSAHVTENFVKSLVYPPYGWADTLPTYITSYIYNFLHIPLNEFWIYAMHVGMGFISIYLIFLVGQMLFNTSTGLVAAILLSILPIQNVIFGSALYYHHDFLILCQLLLLLTLLYYCKRHSWPAALAFSLSLFLNAGTENILVFPSVIIIQYFFERESTQHPFKNIFCFKNVVIWSLPGIMILAHLYIYHRIGESNLGIIGYVMMRYGSATKQLSDIVIMTKKQLTLMYENFFGVYLVCVVAALFLFFLDKISVRRARVAMLMLWISYLLVINIYFGQGNDVTTFRYSHYFLPLILVSSYMTTYIYAYMKNINLKAGMKCLAWIIMGVSIIALATAFLNETGVVLHRKVYHSPLKSVSFYVREHGDENTVVFQLIPSSSSFNYWGEYYFGKLYMEPGEKYGVRRQLFSFGEHDIDDYKAAYGLKEFDFYVDYHGQENFDNGSLYKKKKEFLESLSARGIVKVAEIRRGGSVIATIYSPHPISYEILDADAAEKQWDRKYANLKRLLQNRWCGLSVLWGYHHRLR